MSILWNNLFTLFENTLFQDNRSKIESKSDVIISVMKTDKKISFLFKIFKTSKNWRILGLAFGLNPINLNT